MSGSRAPIPLATPSPPTPITTAPSVGSTSHAANSVNGPGQNSPQPSTNPQPRCYHIVRICCTTLLTLLGLTAGYWTLALGWWTAEKDFRDDCRSQNATTHHISRACMKELEKDLKAPPIPLGLPSKRSELHEIVDWRSVLGLWGDVKSHGIAFCRLNRPSSGVQTAIALTAVCVACPILYWKVRASLLRSYRSNPSPTMWTPVGVARMCNIANSYVPPQIADFHEKHVSEAADVVHASVVCIEDEALEKSWQSVAKANLEYETLAGSMSMPEAAEMEDTLDDDDDDEQQYERDDFLEIHKEDTLLSNALEFKAGPYARAGYSTAALDNSIQEQYGRRVPLLEQQRRLSNFITSFRDVARRYSSTQIKVRKATSNDPWGPTTAQLEEVASLTYNDTVDFYEVIDQLDERLNDKGKNWRHVLKSLNVLDYCLNEGSPLCMTWARENIHLVKTLREFQHVDNAGRDCGRVVREYAKELTALILNEKQLQIQRDECKGRRRSP